MPGTNTTIIDRRRFWTPPGHSTVSSARCLSYNLPDVRKAVARCVEALPDMQEAFHAAHSVLLKPNLLASDRSPDDHVNTHPTVVQSLAELLVHEFHCDVAIGDSCGTVGAGSTQRAIEKSGMDVAAEKAGAAIYNVDVQPRHVAQVDTARVYRQIPLPSNLDQFDLIVSVAKLKTHQLTHVTGPVKNVFGLVPGESKKRAHALAPRVDEFVALICDLYEFIRPRAAFVDGVIGMEGRGPANGSLRHVELIGASCDPVALDSFCAQVMGFDPMSVGLLAQCQERGLGIARPADITVRGEPASAFAPEGFVRPPAVASALVLRLVPRWLLRSALGRWTTRRAVIDQDACKRCGECERNCPSKAIARDPNSGRYRVKAKLCIACCCCTEVCPYDAVALHTPWLKKVARRALAPFR